MLSNLSPYAQQGLTPQFFAPQAPWLSQATPGPFGQQGAYGANSSFGQEAGFGQPGLSQAGLSQPGLSQHYGVQAPTQQIIQLLGHLAQQISVQAAVNQQVGIALQQLAQHLAVQSHSAGFGGQAVGFGGPYGGLGPQAPGWGGLRPQTIQ